MINALRLKQVKSHYDKCTQTETIKNLDKGIQNETRKKYRNDKYTQTEKS